MIAAALRKQIRAVQAAGPSVWSATQHNVCICLPRCWKRNAHVARLELLSCNDDDHQCAVAGWVKHTLTPWHWSFSFCPLTCTLTFVSQQHYCSQNGLSGAGPPPGSTGGWPGPGPAGGSGKGGSGAGPPGGVTSGCPGPG